jgi:hypothetical protein
MKIGIKTNEHGVELVHASTGERVEGVGDMTVHAREGDPLVVVATVTMHGADGELVIVEGDETAGEFQPTPAKPALRFSQAR